MTMMSQAIVEDKAGILEQGATLQRYVEAAAQTGQAAHEVERGLFQAVLKWGHQLLGYFFHLLGDGDQGPEMGLSNGQRVKRLEALREGRCVSGFGELTLERRGYGTREGQRLAGVPLDSRLQLPESDFSYLLQDWAQALAVEVPYQQAGQVLEKVLGLKLAVSALERMTGALAEGVEPYWEANAVQPSAVGEFIVASADGKGVVIRQSSDSAPIQAHDPARGPKPDRKKVAILGGVYDGLPYLGTPKQVWQGLFRVPTAANDEAREPRPEPIAKARRASLTHPTRQGTVVSARATIFAWVGSQVQPRDPESDKALVVLMDGQHCLWDDAAAVFGARQRVEIRDVLQATSKLWDWVHVFHPPGSARELDAMKRFTLLLLQGGVHHLIVWFRHRVKEGDLNASERKRVEAGCTYFANHQDRMRYDQYLAAGYPIASGVIEGACRHVVKDRMERSGMHWSIDGAQAMRKRRCLALNGPWNEFTPYRIQRETERLYPHAAQFQRADWPLAIAA